MVVCVMVVSLKRGGTSFISWGWVWVIFETSPLLILLFFLFSRYVLRYFFEMVYKAIPRLNGVTGPL